jgi:hypothetical protein
MIANNPSVLVLVKYLGNRIGGFFFFLLKANIDIRALLERL